MTGRESLALQMAVIRGPRAGEAYDAARGAHGDARKRIDGTLMIDHVTEVAGLVAAVGFDDDVVAAALMHDTVEHAAVALEEIERRFGGRVRLLVAALTEPDDVEPTSARKAAHCEQAIRAGREARAIFAADKLANARGLRGALRSDPGLGRDAADKLSNYEAALLRLEDVEPDGPFTAALGEEIRRLRDALQRRTSSATP